jgi:hypothetical protein
MFQVASFRGVRVAWRGVGKPSFDLRANYAYKNRSGRARELWKKERSQDVGC